MRSRVASSLPLLALAATAGFGASPADPGNPYGRWQNGPAHGEDFFPIAVWLQSPAKALSKS